MAGRTARLEEIGKQLKALAQCALALKEDIQVELGKDQEKEGNVNGPQCKCEHRKCHDTAKKLKGSCSLENTNVSMCGRWKAACDSPKGDEDPDSSHEVSVSPSNDASQHSEPPLSLHQQQRTSSRAAEAAHLGGDRDQYPSMLDNILKNQEALRKILMNQDTLKGLVDGLLKAVTSIEARVHAIEQEMSLLSRFTEELNAVDTEANWG